MYTKLMRHILLFIGILALQLFVVDNIRFGHFIHPCVYVLYVMLLPFDSSQVKLMLNGFILGMAVDIFNGTPGLNAAAKVLICYLRPYIISLITRKSELEGKNYPSINDMGLQWYVLYALLLLIVHNLTLFLLEAFSFKLFGIVLLETLVSVPVTIVIIILIVYVFRPINSK